MLMLVFKSKDDDGFNRNIQNIIMLQTKLCNCSIHWKCQTHQLLLCFQDWIVIMETQMSQGSEYTRQPQSEPFWALWPYFLSWGLSELWRHWEISKPVLWQYKVCNEMQCDTNLIYNELELRLWRRKNQVQIGRKQTFESIRRPFSFDNKHICYFASNDIKNNSS